LFRIFFCIFLEFNMFGFGFVFGCFRIKPEFLVQFKVGPKISGRPQSSQLSRVKIRSGLRPYFACNLFAKWFLVYDFVWQTPF
jgi:hypothetical protein